MAKFVTIGERLSTTAPAVNKAFMERDPEPILKRAKQQLDAGAVYLDVNIGPADGYGEDLMKWAVQLLQSEFDNVPLALDTSNKAAIEAGISVYNRSKGKPIVNSGTWYGRNRYVVRSSVPGSKRNAGQTDGSPGIHQNDLRHGTELHRWSV